MPPLTMTTALQLIVGLGLLNVWLLRARSATAYRGGASTNLKAEFATYGLPEPVFWLVGALKVTAGVVLVAGLWLTLPVQWAAVIVSMLMLGALAMHAKVKDPAIKSLPAALMLAMSLGIVYLA